MTPAQEKRIMERIDKQIKITVNGKIDNLNIRLTEYIKDDTLWKDQAQPSIDLGKNLRGFGLVGAGFLGLIAAVSGAIIGVLELIKRFK